MSWRQIAWISALGLIGVLLWDASALDLPVMQLWGTAEGFALKDQRLLSHLLHTRGQQASVVAFIFLMVMVWRPLGPWRQLSRRERLTSLLAVVLSLLSVSLLKRWSLTSCPWDLQVFGGVANYVSHWRWGVPDGGGGHCFPGGHASSAMGFLAACLPFLLSSDARLQTTGQRLLALIALLGVVFGLTQTVRGAHYPSHTFWTAWICWSVGALAYRLMQRQALPQARPISR
jgi:membrane-associated PAP2 superfamily phosphatase